MISQKKAGSKKISDPVDYFSAWHFKINAHLYAALGLTWRSFVLKKKPYTSMAIDYPTRYGFEVGDIFYPQDSSSTQFLQVAVAGGDGLVEVHAGLVGVNQSRDAYKLWEYDFAEWLKTGVIPYRAEKILPGMSKAGLLGWQLLKSEPLRNEVTEIAEATIVPE